MLYAIFCYNSEPVMAALSKQEEEAILAKRHRVTDRLRAEGKLGPVARLLPTSTAVTVRNNGEPVVLDGPFAETKEALLGFYVVDCANLDEVIEAAREMVGDTGSLEIRPLRNFMPAEPGA